VIIWSKNIDYLKTQIGNPDGADVPNKKYYDPRKWMRERNDFQRETRASICRLENNVNTL
jgi:fructose-bisphosphate aldolase class II